MPGRVFASLDLPRRLRRLLAIPDVIVGSVAALTETGSLVDASGSGSQLPGHVGGHFHAEDGARRGLSPTPMLGCTGSRPHWGRN